MKRKNFWKKHKKKIIILILILIVIIKIATGNQSNVPLDNKPALELIEKRDIATSISATGKITTETTQNVLSSLTGLEIATVSVKEGDRVAIGDVICTFDMSKVQTNLSDAKSTANISNAQSNLSIESARRNLDQAIANKDNELAGVKSALQSAEQAYVSAQNQFATTQNAIATKQNELNTANTTSAQIQSTLTTIPETDPKRAELQQNLANLETTKTTLSTEIAGLQAMLPELQATLNELKGVYDTAVSNYNTATSSLDSNIATMQDSVKNAELSAASSNIAQKEQLSTFEEQLEKGIVTATTAGMVSSVNVKVGDLYTGSTIATIHGTDPFIIEAQIDEYNIPDVTVGMEVFIKTDATREEELKGKITYVAQTPTTATLDSTTAVTSAGESNATYLIKIALSTPNERLRLGMNAKLSIVTSLSTNTWSVPYDCVQEREDGTHYIEVAKNETGEEKEEINVEKGIEGSYYVEIKSPDLAEGMRVVLPQIEVGNSVDDLIMNMGPGAGM